MRENEIDSLRLPGLTNIYLRTYNDYVYLLVTIYISKKARAMIPYVISNIAPSNQFDSPS